MLGLAKVKFFESCLTNVFKSEVTPLNFWQIEKCHSDYPNQGGRLGFWRFRCQASFLLGTKVMFGLAKLKFFEFRQTNDPKSEVWHDNFWQIGQKMVKTRIKSRIFETTENAPITASLPFGTRSMFGLANDEKNFFTKPKLSGRKRDPFIFDESKKILRITPIRG